MTALRSVDPHPPAAPRGAATAPAPRTAPPTGLTAPPPPTPAAPCTGAYARFAAVFPALRIRATPPRAEDDWTPTTRLLADPLTRARLITAEARRGLARFGEPPRPDVAAGFWLHRYTWPVCLLFSLPWFLERRVPRLPVDRVSFRCPPTGGPVELATRLEDFACLPEDPAAALPGARVVPDEAALRTELRASVAEHLAPVLSAFRPALRRGPRTLWGLATDELTEGLWYAGSLLGEESRAVRALAVLLPGDTAPFTGSAAFRSPDRAGRQAPGHTRTRVSCCLHYTVRPTDACAGCPRICK